MPEDKNAPQTVGIALNHPVTEGSKTITELTLRRPKVKDVMEAQRRGGSSLGEVEIHMIALVAGVSAATVEQLDLEDYQRIQAAMQAMTNGAR